MVDPDADVLVRVLSEETQVAARNLDAVGHLACDPFEAVLDQLKILAFDLGHVANACVTDLEETGNDRQGPVDIVDDTGVDLTASADDLLIHLHLLQIAL